MIAHGHNGSYNNQTEKPSSENFIKRSVYKYLASITISLVMLVYIFWFINSREMMGINYYEDVIHLINLIKMSLMLILTTSFSRFYENLKSLIWKFM